MYIYKLPLAFLETRPLVPPPIRARNKTQPVASVSVQLLSTHWLFGPFSFYLHQVSAIMGLCCLVLLTVGPPFSWSLRRSVQHLIGSHLSSSYKGIPLPIQKNGSPVGAAITNISFSFHHSLRHCYRAHPSSSLLSISCILPFSYIILMHM